MKKKILIIYTGGTIGMTASANGYAPNKEAFHQYLSEMPELKVEAMPDWEIVDMDPLLDSSNIAVKEWNKIGELIADKYDFYDGFVILHGTDTMAYTASALSFMLENNSKPIVITGSQIPLCEIRNDARSNIITSMMIAAEGVIKEVSLFFGGKLIRGNRATKISSDELFAFDSPNFPHLADARVNIMYNEVYHSSKSNAFTTDEQSIESLKNKIIKNNSPFDEEDFHLQRIIDQSIGVIKIFPGMNFEIFEPIMTKDLKAIVIEAFGAGNIPNNGDALIPLIKKAKEHDTILIVCSQCLKGSVNLGSYEASSGLCAAGAISGLDITTEAAVAKLYYLFSCGYDVDIIKRLMLTNLRGEITVK